MKCDNKIGKGITGKIKDKLPNDLIGSTLVQPSELNEPISSYKVAGIYYDFIPQVLPGKLVNFWVKTNQKKLFYYSPCLVC